jgi:hypothetical protein
MLTAYFGSSVHKIDDFKKATVSTLEPEARLKIFKDSVRTAKKAQHLTVTKINRLTLFKEIIAVYSENNKY